MSSTVKLLDKAASTSNAEAACQGWAKLLDRRDQIEQQLATFFADVVTGMERMGEVKSPADMQMTAGLAAAFSAFKQNQAASKGARSPTPTTRPTTGGLPVTRSSASSAVRDAERRAG